MRDEPKLPKNIIFCIGDGMGFEKVKAAGLYAHGEAGTLSFEAFPYQGEVTTHSGGFVHDRLSRSRNRFGYRIQGQQRRP